MKKVDYAKNRTPYFYKCSKCGTMNRKLWREYQTCLDAQTFYCADCACKHTGKDRSRITKEGRYNHEDIGPCDSFGWLVPAVPTEEGDTYWGYTSVPQAGVDWWRRLPNGD